VASAVVQDTYYVISFGIYLENIDAAQESNKIWCGGGEGLYFTH
jgi:hypothetical protein